MKNTIFFLVGSLFFLICPAQADLTACGQVTFEKNMTCEKPSVVFNTESCDSENGGQAPATKVTCAGGEMIALLKTKNGNYRAVLTQASDKTWVQKGRVWRSSASTSPGDVQVSLKSASTGAVIASAPVVSTPIDLAVKQSTPAPEEKINEIKAAANEKPAPIVAEVKAIQDQQAQIKVEEKKPEVTITPAAEGIVTVAAATSVTTATVVSIENAPKATEKNDSWNFHLTGWSIVENEYLENFGDGVTNAFSANDPLSKQSDVNMLADLQFVAKKDRLTFNSVLEIGEIFFGESTTGGNQGVNGKVVKVKNLFADEEIGNFWHLKAGLWNFSSDPHNFILNSNMAGLSLYNETSQYLWRLWYAVATDNKPGSTTNSKDSYVGLSHTQKMANQSSWSLFAVYRGLRETFVDNNDLTTLYTGKSSYTWAGFNLTNKNPNAMNSEFNAIVVTSKFTDDGGVGNDSNSGWLGHFRLDHDFAGSWNLALDALGTSGVDSSRNSAGRKMITRRGNYATGASNFSYLLTLATSDGLDEAPGSLRASTGGIANLDNDEGLRIGVITLSKSFGDKWSSFLRYGMIQSAIAKAATASNAMGTEMDFNLKYNLSKASDISIDWASFKPGAYFTNTDTANLTTMRYKTEF